LFPVDPNPQPPAAARSNRRSIDELFPVTPATPAPATSTRSFGLGPTNERSTLERVTAPPIAAAQGTLGGTAQLVGGALELLPGQVGRTGAAVSRFGQEQARQARERNYILGTAGEFAPSLLPLGRVLRGATAGERMLRGAAVGGALGAAAPTGREEYEERLPGKATAAALGATLGAAVPAVTSVVGSAATGVLGRVEPQVAALASRAEQLGFRLEPAQLRATSPASSAGFGAAAEGNQQVSNRLASRAMGEEAEKITPDYLNRRFEDLGRQYNDIFIGPPSATPRTFKLDAAALQALEEVATREASLAAGGAPAARSLASEITDRFQSLQRQMPNTRITQMNVTGDELQRLRTEMRRVYRTSTDNVDSGVAMEVIKAMDDSIARNHPATAARLAEVSPQYRAAITMEKLAPYRGNVSAEDLGRLLERTDRNFARGTTQTPLYELGRLGLDLRIRSLDQPTSRIDAAGSVPLGRLERILGVGLRTQPATSVQRRVSEGPLQNERSVAAPIPLAYPTERERR